MQPNLGTPWSRTCLNNPQFPSLPILLSRALSGTDGWGSSISELWRSVQHHGEEKSRMSYHLLHSLFLLFSPEEYAERLSTVVFLICCYISSLWWCTAAKKNFFVTELTVLSSFAVDFLFFLCLRRFWKKCVVVLPQMVFAWNLIIFLYLPVKALPWMKLYKSCHFSSSAKCSYMGQTFSEGQRFLSRSCRECKVSLHLTRLRSFCRIPSPLTSFLYESAMIACGGLLGEWFN